jgi:hypothetical protein
LWLWDAIDDGGGNQNGPQLGDFDIMVHLEAEERGSFYELPMYADAGVCCVQR